MDIVEIRKSPKIMEEALIAKNIDFDMRSFLLLDDEVRELKRKTEDIKSRQNILSKEIQSSDTLDRDILIERSKKLKDELKVDVDLLKTKENSWKDLYYSLPQVPSKKAPNGKSDEDNIVLETVGKPRNFEEEGFTPLSHMELIRLNNWGDFERSSKVSGARSYTLQGDLFLYEQALFSYTLQKLRSKNFKLFSVPSLIRGEVFKRSTTVSENDSYELKDDGSFLVPTSEYILTNWHGGEILEEAELPKLYGGYSACFRKEAGSYGKDTKGLMRLHQFNKVEQVVLCKADDEVAEKMHLFILENAKELMTDLELPFEVMECCTGDMGKGKHRMFDINSWVPSENCYRETHSASSFLEWQARKMDLRYRETASRKVKFVYTLNNTMLALPRTFISLLENHQEFDEKSGYRVSIPTKLRPFMGGEKYLKSNN
ncbi:MAG: serine--tRNA ligase [Alphaproteobacteria bacterium]|nr:serine--tRNA ligase [Alphaproteobacteria bacterium]MBL0718132.1 serine--tRNA ligase [Alphaproteobacteria bacterium]